jgi:hypothetical protein
MTPGTVETVMECALERDVIRISADVFPGVVDSSWLA